VAVLLAFLAPLGAYGEQTGLHGHLDVILRINARKFGADHVLAVINVIFHTEGRI
jgi:hypothetical protein